MDEEVVEGMVSVVIPAYNEPALRRVVEAVRSELDKTSRQALTDGQARIKALADFLTFPVRTLTFIEKDKLGLSSLASERYYYVSGQVRG